MLIDVGTIGNKSLDYSQVVHAFAKRSLPKVHIRAILDQKFDDKNMSGLPEEQSNPIHLNMINTMAKKIDYKIYLWCHNKCFIDIVGSFLDQKLDDFQITILNKVQGWEYNLPKKKITN